MMRTVMAHMHIQVSVTGALAALARKGPTARSDPQRVTGLRYAEAVSLQGA